MNNVFCTAPWVHLHSWPDGRVVPCCFGDYNESKTSSDYQNISDGIHTALNSNGMKEVRRNMLNGEPSNICRRCYQSEKESDNGSSIRTWFNSAFDNNRTQNIIAKTHADGYLPEIDIQYLDVRFSNICNLKCRMCGHDFSSSWYDEEKQFHDDRMKREGKSEPFNKPKFIKTDSYSEIEPLLESVTEIYFAGGEPTLYPEHLDMLLRLIELGRTDVVLKYNSNLTNLRYKGYNFIDLWNKFDSVTIGASIDSYGAAAEYIRTGCQWSTVAHNFTTVLNECPNVHIFPQVTVGAMNVEILPEFWKYIMARGWDNADFWPNFVDSPYWFNFNIFPEWYRISIIDKIEKFKEYLLSNSKSNHIPGFNTIQESLKHTPYTSKEATKHLRFMFMMLDVYDNSSHLNWKKSMPHLYSLQMNINTNS